MSNIISSPPQKNLNIAPQQLNSDVMASLKKNGQPSQPPQIEKAKGQIRQYITQYKIDPQLLIKIGQMASKALHDPSVYQMVVELAVKNGIVKKEEVTQGKDYRLLGYAITVGKLTEQLVNEGLK